MCVCVCAGGRTIAAHHERWEAEDYAELQMDGREGGELPPVHAAWHRLHTPPRSARQTWPGQSRRGMIFSQVQFTGRYGPRLLFSCHNPGESQRSSEL